MSEVASDIISNIESYQQLLTTLSLAVSAGLFALLAQVIFHNVQSEGKIRLEAPYCIFAAIVLNFVSIGFGVATKMALVASVPALHKIDWQDFSATASLRQAGLQSITWYSMGQITFFLIGIVSLLYPLWRNLQLLNK